VIDPVEHIEDIIMIQQLAWANYSVAYRPELNPEGLRENIVKYRNYRVLGAFSVDSNQLSGYALITEYEDLANFVTLKVIP